MHRLSSILQLFLQLGKKLLLNNGTIRRCLRHFLKLLLWARRNCRLSKGLSDGRSSDATRDGVAASLTYEKETPVSGMRSVGHWDPEENKYESCTPHVSYLKTSTPVPGIVRVTDAIACLVHPSPSQLSPTKDVDSQPEQIISGSPGPQDILLLPEYETAFESRSLECHTLRPFVPEMLGRYDRNIEM